MFDLKGADGNALFNTLRVGLSCEKCQRDGKAESCTHMKDIIPPWKSAAKFDMVAAIVSVFFHYHFIQIHTNIFFSTVTVKICWPVSLWVKCT